MLVAQQAKHVYGNKKKVDGLYPTLAVFTGNEPVGLLGFLYTMRDALNSIGASEAVWLGVIAYYL